MVPPQNVEFENVVKKFLDAQGQLDVGITF